MIILRRIGVGITKHLPARASEWALALILFIWALNCIFTPGYLERPAWLWLADHGSQGLWGGAALVIAALRLLALIINGTFADTAWSRRSPHVRAAMAFLSCFFWLSQSLSVWITDVTATGLSASVVFFALDIYNIVRTSTDARHADEAWKHGRNA